MSEALMSSSCLALRPSPEAADISGQDRPVSARRAEVLAEEFVDFITRQVLEQDAQFFDG